LLFEGLNFARQPGDVPRLTDGKIDIPLTLDPINLSAQCFKAISRVLQSKRVPFSCDINGDF
jgi:hypothetical protein